MAAMPQELMGYDRAITMFSPDGRLLQVEYARKTVSQGTLAIGIATKHGVVLVADKRIIEKLVIPESVEKIFQIAEHIACTMSGLISDGRVLVDKGQEEAQRQKITYDEKIDVIEIVKEICTQKQIFTQYAGGRPYGVSLLIGGVDTTGPRLFMTEPSGIYFEYHACAIGEGAATANKFLESNYSTDMTVDDAMKLGLKTVKKVLIEKFSKDRIEVACIPSDTQKFRKLGKEEIEKLMKE